MFLFRKTLYFPGCFTSFILKDIRKNYENILESMGVDFFMLKENFCCGFPAFSSGYKNEFENLFEKNVNLFKENSFSKIITNCPECYFMFLKEYPFEVEHISETILENIDSLKLNDFNEERVSYFEPCYLGRHSGIHDAPREILKKLNFNVVELKKAICCGAGGGLKFNAPKLSGKIARELLKEVKTKKLITTCPICYSHLKENSEDVEVIELSQVIV